jgi:hypothetical protein
MADPLSLAGLGSERGAAVDTTSAHEEIIALGSHSTESTPVHLKLAQHLAGASRIVENRNLILIR